MIRARYLLLAALLIPTFAAAQEEPIVEIGTGVGVTILAYEESTVTYFGIPWQGLRSQPSMYVSLFAGDPILVDLQFALNIASYERGSHTTVGSGAQMGYLFNGSAANSPFIAADFGIQYERVSVEGNFSFSDSATDAGLGGKIGYRFLIGRSFALRVEGGYRRWIDSSLNELRVGLSIGGIVHHAR